MINELVPYTQVKETGLPWVPKIPQHWDLIPNKALVRQRKRLVGASHAQYQLLSLTKQGVIVRDLRTLKGKFSADLGTSQEVLPGDLVFCFFDVPETPRTIGLSRYPGMITGAYTVLQCIGSCSREFFEAFYIAMDDRKLLGPLYTGLRNTIPPATFLHIKTPVPPPCEQREIVRFVAYVDRRIRRYIRAKQKLIKLLEEQKQAIIHTAVTKGLDANVRLKPSGVEWLGDTPAHWLVMPIKRAFASMTYGISESATDAGTVRLLTMGHIQGGKVLVPTQGGVQSVAPSLMLDKGDLLFNRTNSAELVGKVGLFTGASGPVTFASYLVRMRPTSDVDPEFLNLLLNDSSVLSVARREAIPSLHQSNLNPTRYGRLHIALPTLNEQKWIVSHIATATHGLRLMIDNMEREINLLREYHVRLIGDIVTGKFDVRDLAAELDEESEESNGLNQSYVENSAEETVIDDLDEMREPVEA